MLMLHVPSILHVVLLHAALCMLHPTCCIVACCNVYVASCCIPHVVLLHAALLCRDITLRAADGSDERYESELGTEMVELLHALTASHAR